MAQIEKGIKSRYSSETPEKYPNNDNHFETISILSFTLRGDIIF